MRFNVFICHHPRKHNEYYIAPSVNKISVRSRAQDFREYFISTLRCWLKTFKITLYKANKFIQIKKKYTKTSYRLNCNSVNT